MRLLDYLDNKQKAEQAQQEAMRAQQKAMRRYNDIAFILWYQVLYDEVLKHKREQMEVQQTPFRVYDWGDKAMRFGPVAALTSAEDIEKFERRAKAVLKDRGFGSFKVKAYPDSIMISVV